MNIHIGNLSRQATENDLRKAFESFGQITAIKIIKARFTSESEGIGFIEMPAKQEAETAMEDLSGTELDGKTISVNEARPRSENHRNGGGRQISGVWQNRY